MDRRVSSNTMEELGITVDTVRPLIESFFTRMRAEQWRRVNSGAHDDATKVMLAELLLDIIATVSRALLTALMSQNALVSAKNVRHSLGDALSQSFAEVLDLKEQVQCVSSEQLTALLGEEITESVNSVLSTSEGSAEPVLNRLVPPRRLNAMIGHALKMLKAFTAKMKILCRPRRQRRSQSTTVETLDDEDQLKLEDIESEETDQSQVSFVEPEISEEVSSKDSVVSETSKAVQEIISKEVSAIIEPLLDDVSDSEYELLQSESFLEIKIVAEDIAQSSTDESKNLKEKESAGPSPKSQQNHSIILKGVGRKISNFFAKGFAKASIHRIIAQLKAKFHKNSEVESRESIQSLVASVESLLLTKNAEKQEGGNEICVFWTFKNISPSTVRVFTKELSDLLYGHFTDGMMPEVIPEPIRKKESCRTVSVPESHADMYADIWNKVMCFLSLMNWWLNTQAARHSDRVTLALMESLATSALPEETALVASGAVSASVCEETYAEPVQDATGREEKDKMFVRIVVEKLISRIYKKSKVVWTIGDPEDMIQRLFEKLWAEVEGTDFVITPETLKNLDKAVYKDLLKEWGCADMVLVSVSLGEPVLEKRIVSAIKHHLTSPKQHNTISRFFSSMRKTVSKILRCRKNRVGVM